jgi:hypothetical protein
VIGLPHGRETVLNVKRAIGIEERLKDSFPQICGLPTTALLEIGKKENKEVLSKVIPVIQKELEKGKRMREYHVGSWRPPQDRCPG